jgi:adenine phosphoribosyltransferase
VRAWRDYTHRPSAHGRLVDSRPASTRDRGDEEKWVDATGSDAEKIELLKSRIRDIPDFPQPGVLFRDITPLLADPAAFRVAIDGMAAPFAGIQHIVAIESRGFILGAPVAYRLNAGLVLVRKVGKLPAATIREEYGLEYGANTVEIHSDAIRPGERVIIVDDVLATGGTVRAAANLVERLGATVVGISLLIEIGFLGGRERLTGYDVSSLITY